MPYGKPSDIKVDRFNPQPIAFSETNTGKNPEVITEVGVHEGLTSTSMAGVTKSKDVFAPKNS